MAKDKTVYVCANCGQESPKWVGRCPACGEWNTFKEFTVRKEGASAAASGGFSQALPGEPLRRRPIPVGQIVTDEEPRLDMHDEELNRVLGGGLVPGSLVLLGGEPGIGKSTLVLQTVLKMTDKRVLYVSGEESARQLKLRADRLVPRAGGKADGREGFLSRSSCMVVCETSLDQIFLHVRNEQPQLLVIDSIQTIMTEAVDSSPGSISQVRECAALLLKFAKESNIPVILIGHINKEGTLAGPKVLEHIVDAVLQFEGDQHYMYRILRSIKNRFGSTAELGIYEMRQDGLRQVSNPSELLLTERRGHLFGHRGRTPLPHRDASLGQHGGLRHAATFGHRLRPAPVEYVVGRVGKARGLQTGAERRVPEHSRRVESDRPGHRLVRHCRRAEQQCGHGYRKRRLHGRGSRLERRDTSGKPYRAARGGSGQARFPAMIVPRHNLQGFDTSKLKIELVPVRKVEEALRALFG